MRECGQSLRERTQDRNAGACRQVEGAHDHRRADHGNQDSRQELAAFQQKDDRERRGADGEGSPVHLPGEQRADDRPELTQRTLGVDREAEELRQLADQHGQRDAVHVPVADRLGQELGDEAQTRDARHNAHRARHDRHRPRQRDGTLRIAGGERHDHGEDDGGQRGIRAQHHDAAGAEQRVGKQRNDRRVETVDAGQARRDRIRDADRHEHRRQHDPRRDVVGKPLRLVARQGVESRQPTPPPGLRGGRLPAHDAARFAEVSGRGCFAHPKGAGRSIRRAQLNDTAHTRQRAVRCPASSACMQARRRRRSGA